jgi:LmbE family N-acetylglucosaminyl deacetylase
MAEDADVPAAARTGPVLAVFAHPDDAEICAGGVLTQWAQAGREVHLLILTNGDRGSGDAARDRAELATTRAAETHAAATVMGLASVRIIDAHDGDLQNTAEVREPVVRRIREVQAETVVSCDPTSVFFENRYYNHSDHRMAGWIALDAAFPAAGNPHFLSEHLAEGLEAKDVFDVWLGWSNEPNHAQDVTEQFPTKVAALGEHQSQISEGIRFWNTTMREEAKAAGERHGVGLAEEFRVLDLS